MAKGTNRWDSIFTDWEASGLTKKAYCQKHGYSANAFYAAMRRRRMTTQVPAQQLVQVYPQQLDQPKSLGNPLVIRIDSRVTIEVPNVSMLGSVLKALGV